MTTVLVLAGTAEGLALRHAKSLQRLLAAGAQDAAAARLAAAGCSVEAVNRSHSRGLAAVAAASVSGPLGVDVEYADPARPWGKIIGSFADADLGALGPEPAAAVWTFIEAWYKAFQSWPPGDHVRAALNFADASPGSPQPFDSPDGRVWWSLDLAAPGFPVSVVSGCEAWPVRIDLPPLRL